MVTQQLNPKDVCEVGTDGQTLTNQSCIICLCVCEREKEDEGEGGRKEGETEMTNVVIVCL